MGKVFRIFFDRIKSETPVANQQGLADALGVNRSAVTQAKNLDRIPQRWILQLSRRFGLSPDWLEYGAGSPRSARQAAFSSAPSGLLNANLPGSEVFARREAAPRKKPDRCVAAESGTYVPLEHGALYQVPKVRARLSAGGGSLEVESQVVGSRSFDLSWLRRMGRPAAMELMDVVGDSMAPGILDGDTVLVDRGQAEVVFGGIYAIGHNDAILLKRIRQAQDGIALISDNPEFGPVLLHGDDLQSFRIIGRVVWLCREC